MSSGTFLEFGNNGLLEQKAAPPHENSPQITLKFIPLTPCDLFSPKLCQETQTDRGYPGGSSAVRTFLIPL